LPPGIPSVYAQFQGGNLQEAAGEDKAGFRKGQDRAFKGDNPETEQNRLFHPDRKRPRGGQRRAGQDNTVHTKNICQRNTRNMCPGIRNYDVNI
jgi:hypothetical protein